MIGLLVKRALADLRTAFEVTYQYDPADVRSRTGARQDMGLLEERVLFSATPLGPAPESTDPAEGDAESGDWLADVDFSDDGEMFAPQSGSWRIIDGWYEGESQGDAISTLLLDEPLTENLELSLTVNVDDASADHLSNGFVIFDYHSPTDFKFAGAYAGTDRWIVGHRTASAWVTDVFHQSPIDALTDYELRLSITGDTQVTLYVNGSPHLTHTYADSLSDGQLGVGLRDAVSRFDDIRLRSLEADESATPGELPLHEDFEDHAAEHLQPEVGNWVFIDGEYRVSPDLSAVGISTLLLSDPLPNDLEIGVSFNADELSPSRFSNGFVVFDYHSPTDFKYAGGFIFRDEWAIGHRTAEGWNDEIIVTAPLDAFTDYNIRVVIADGSEVSLYQADTLIATHAFSESVIDGAIGLGSDNSVTRFDDFSVVDNSSWITAEMSGRHLVVSGEAAGEVQIIALQSDTFQVFDNGKLIHTIENVKGNLLVELGDDSDQLVIDLGGNSFRRSVMVDLGGGHNDFEIKNGLIYGSLRIESGDGDDSVTVADDLLVRRRAKVSTGGGDDLLDVSGRYGRSLVVKTGDGDDDVKISSQTRFLVAQGGAGDDSVKLCAQGRFGYFSLVNLGEGDDSYEDDRARRPVTVIDRDRPSGEMDDDWKFTKRRNFAAVIERVFEGHGKYRR